MMRKEGSTRNAYRTWSYITDPAVKNILVRTRDATRSTEILGEACRGDCERTVMTRGSMPTLYMERYNLKDLSLGSCRVFSAAASRRGVKSLMIR
jgi:hypothetical protein